MPLKPKSLPAGATIGICAPSSRINAPFFDEGVAFLRAQGFIPVIHPQTQMEWGQIAGPADRRAQAFTDLLGDPKIDAVILSGGGHRAAELLPLLDWDRLAKLPPKIVMGFSDTTALLFALNARLGWVTFYGPAIQALGRTHAAQPENWTNALCLLQGTMPAYRLTYAGPQIEGPVIAGTLSILPLLLDTPDCPDFTGAILCIEDINEEASSIDRLLLLLKRKNVLHKIAALVCGEFKNIRDGGARPFGFTLAEIVLHHAGDLPIAFDAPFGHGGVLYALPFGVKARLADNALTMLEPSVAI